MSVFLVPTDTGGALFWTQTTTLDGTPYLLTFRYNSREQAYYLTIQSADAAVTYAQGIKVVSDFLLLQTYTTPPGELQVFTIGDDSPARPGDWGRRAFLLYYEQADVISYGVEPQRDPGGFPVGS